MVPQVRAASAFAEVKFNKRAAVGHPHNYSTAIAQMVNLSCKAGLIKRFLNSKLGNTTDTFSLLKACTEPSGLWNTSVR